MTPSDSGAVNQTQVDVLWTIDGVEQDSLNVERLEEGEYLIIREAYDRAGNFGSDTVTVYVIIPKVETSTDLVTALISRDDAQTLEEISTIKGRDVSASEAWSFSFLDRQVDPTGNTYTEVMVGERDRSSNDAIDEVKTLDNPTSYDPSLINSPQIKINMELPLSKDIGGIPGTGTCEESGEPRWDHYIEALIVYQYDHLGQFANRFTITGPIKIENVSDFQDDQGELTAMMELPMVDNKLLSYDNRQLGTGVYILKINTRIRSVPNSDCNDDQIIIGISESMHNMGYQHP